MRRWIFGGGYVEEDIWRWISGGRYVEVDMWRKMCGGGYVEVDKWRKICIIPSMRGIEMGGKKYL